MLHFATIALSNPKRPDLPVVVVQAIVTNEKFRLSISEKIAKKLQLEKITDHEAREMGEINVRFMPFMGPLCVNHDGIETFSGALVCSDGVVIGELLARELQMTRSAVALEDNVAAPKLPAFVTPTPSRDEPGPSSRIMVVENAIDIETCRAICEYAAMQPRERAGVLDIKVDPRLPEKSFTEISQRDTFRVPINAAMFEKLKVIFYKIITQHIEPFFGVEIAWWELPQMLSYFEGGRYGAHVDADRWIDDGNGKGHWEPFLDRDISILLYLNDTFTGGKLNFPNHGIKIQPEPGLLVAFPSSSKYRHGAEPTESGERLVLVSWSAIKGKQRIRDERPKNVVFTDWFQKPA